MKLHYLLLITIHLSFFSTPSVFGQQNKPCNNFDCAYKKAENFLKQAAYQKLSITSTLLKVISRIPILKKKNKLS